MPTISTIHEARPVIITGFEALIQTRRWEAYDGWMSDQLKRLEITWQAASSPKAWNGADRHTWRDVNR